MSRGRARWTQRYYPDPPPPMTSPGVTNVTAALPLTSTGGATPNLGINPATDLAAGSMSAADKTKLDGLGIGGSNIVDFFTNRPATPLKGTAFYTIDGPIGFIFDGAIWRPIVDSTSAFGPAPMIAAGGWSTVLAAGAVTTFVDSFGTVLIEMSNGGAGEDIRAGVRAIGSVHYDLIANITGGYPENLATMQFGLILRDSTTGNVELFTKRGDGTGNATFARHRATANNTGGSPTFTFNSELTCSVDWAHNCQGYWFRIRDDGTNRTCFVSINGFDWIEAGQPGSLFSSASGTFLNPDEWGIAAFSSAAGGNTVIARLNAVTLTPLA